MAAAIKQIYIPEVNVKGSFMEELGATDDKIIYPGKGFSVTLSVEDFENSEDYHTAWIILTRAVKAKLAKNAEARSS
jgi:hypothetical protein